MKKKKILGIIICLIVIASLCFLGNAVAFQGQDANTKLNQQANKLLTPDVKKINELASDVRANIERLTQKRSDIEISSWNLSTETPHRIISKNIRLGKNIQINKDNIESLTKNFILSQRDLLKADITNLKLIRAHNINNKWYVTYQQYLNNIPVYYGLVEIRMSGKGEISLFGSDYHSEIEISTKPSILDEKVIRIAQKDIEFNESTDSIFSYPGLIVLPVQDGGSIKYQLAYRLVLSTKNPIGSWVFFIDAHNGTILAKYNNIKFYQIDGSVNGEILPQYYDDELVQKNFIHERVEVQDIGYDYTDLDGYFSITGDADEGEQFTLISELKGPYVDVDYEDGDDAIYLEEIEAQGTYDWTWDASLGRQDELNVYYHVNRIHDYVKNNLGFSGMDYQMKAMVSVFEYWDNAFYNPDDESINFGAGGVAYRNFALFSDVIYHEYAHGVTDHIYPEGSLPYFGQSGAMNEGFSDYFACTISNEPYLGEGGLSKFGLPYMRTVDNSARYPDDYINRVHHDSMIFSGSLWDLREMLIDKYGENYGIKKTDTLSHLARFGYPENFEDYLLELLFVDDDNGNIYDGTPNSVEIYTAFSRHGIGPEPTAVGIQYFGSFIDDANGNNNGLLDPGETVELEVTLLNNLIESLGGYAIHNVTARLVSVDPYITVSNKKILVGDLKPQETGVARFKITLEDAPVDWNDYQIDFSLEITGSPVTTNNFSIDATDFWQSNFRIPVAFLDLTHRKSWYYDEELGNNDRFANPGETGEILIAVKNTGLLVATGVVVKVASNSPYVFVLEDEAYIEDIDPGDSGYASVMVQFSDTVPVGIEVDFKAEISADEGFLMYFPIEIFVPRIIFDDHASSSGVVGDSTYYLQQAVFGDYDNDNDLDIYMAMHEDWTVPALDLLYRNNADGTYTELGEEAGVNSLLSSTRATFFDYNNDNWLDLFILHDEDNTLFRNNADGTFTDVTMEADIDTNGQGNTNNTAGILIGDFDNDGWLDVFTGGAFYRNNADGSFTDIIEHSGIIGGSGYKYVSIALDFDNDNDLDILWSSRDEDVLYRNDGNFTFFDISIEAGILEREQLIISDIAIGDYNNDGWLDVYIVSRGGYSWYNPTPNMLYRNNGDSTFSEVGAYAGVIDSLALGGDAIFADYNNDGYLDIFVANEGRQSEDCYGGCSRSFQADSLFINNGNDTFSDIVSGTMATAPEVGSTLNWRISSADSNDDGFLDIYYAHTDFDSPDINQLLINDYFTDTQNNWLKVKLEGTTSNKDGIGAKVKVVCDGQEQLREVSNHQGQSLEVEFGLKGYSSIDLLEITWPSGQMQSLQDIAANQTIAVIEEDRPPRPHPGKKSILPFLF